MIAGWVFTLVGALIFIISITAYISGHHRCPYCHEHMIIHVISGTLLVSFGIALVVTT